MSTTKSRCVLFSKDSDDNEIYNYALTNCKTAVYMEIHQTIILIQQNNISESAYADDLCKTNVTFDSYTKARNDSDEIDAGVNNAELQITIQLAIVPASPEGDNKVKFESDHDQKNHCDESGQGDNTTSCTNSITESGSASINPTRH